MKVAQQGRGQRVVTNEEPNLYIAVKGSLCEVGRRYEHNLVVGDHGLGMKHTTGTVPILVAENASMTTNSNFRGGLRSLWRTSH